MQRALYGFAVIIWACFLWGCVGPSINWNDPQAIAASVEVKPDDFKKLTAFVGPNCAPDRLSDMLLLRAWQTRDGAKSYQIYVADEYTYEIVRGGSGWRHYSEAYDSGGNRLNATVINRTVNWCGRHVCSYTETLGMEIPKSYLDEHRDQGIHFKINGTNGEEVFMIPAAYVQGFLAVSH